MTGVWMFNNGVPKLVENQAGAGLSQKLLVHVPTDEAITSYQMLEEKLVALGWQRYYDDPNFLQFHKRSSIDLISVPRDFLKFNAVYMYDIVVKNPNMFRVMNNYVAFLSHFHMFLNFVRVFDLLIDMCG
ncbi:flowering-promoting factor 1-like protein 1 [Beta vulgaris subsp. vulgaris]|uniref:flowering-promoting factor 1-like protein 1 n=1 Tax=Beta vulgaris subsp. vulgaris TaxID=3555 RepID=UPI002037373D|nr:flowering-promoting factor 1-like protein 1 [Beta vulgaris subsp. vulgaris]